MAQPRDHQHQRQMSEDDSHLQEYDDEQQDYDGRESPPVDDARPGSVDNSQVYAAFGRDTAAGRAMFKLYNKNKTSYAPAVTIRTKSSDPQADAAEKKRREAAALVKRPYQPPRLKKAEVEPEIGRVPLWGGKKTTNTIDLENDRDRHLYKAPSIPLSKLMHRDVEKKKLQDAHVKTNPVPAPLPGRGKILRQETSSRWTAPSPLDRFVFIEEIDERHTFLDSMRALGDSSHEVTVKGEIAERLRDLKKLQALMDDAAATSRTSRAAPAAAARSRDR